MTNDDIVVVHRLVATSLSVTWHLETPPGVDVASTPFVGDVSLPRHSCCGGCARGQTEAGRRWWW